MSASSCPARRTLTLAEVEVYSDGRNVARQGKATQKNTAYGGNASKAIDGKTGGQFGDGGQTHTEENTANPWWEVDLKGEMPINSIVVCNRTDGDLGKRLDGFTLKVLDAKRARSFSRRRSCRPRRRRPPSRSAANRRSNWSAAAAMNALTSVRGQEAATFKALARSSRTTPTATPPSVPFSASRLPTGRRKRPSRCWTACSPTSARSRWPSAPRRPRWTPCNWPIRWRRSCL